MTLTLDESTAPIRERLTLIQARPDVAAQWHPSKNHDVDLSAISRATPKSFWWLCDQGHEWLMSVAARTRQNQGCPYCSGKRILVGFNDLATLRPDVAVLWHPHKNGDLTPEKVTVKSGKRVYWLCAKGHESRLAVSEMTRPGRLCAYCSGRKIAPGENDLRSLYPQIAVECAHTKDQLISPGSHSLVEWKCVENPLHNTWQATPKDRVRGSGCPSCSGSVVVVGVTDLAHKRPDLASQWDDSNELTMHQVAYGSHYKAKWKCKEGHLWEASVYSRAIANYGCPVCKSSVGEQAIYDYILSLLGDESLVIHHDRTTLKRKELDIYVPSKKIAIEFNGIYWHSENKISDTKYHYNKWAECKTLGIQLIQIWEDEWLSSPELIKSILDTKLGCSEREKVSGRQTTVKVITKKESDAFLNQNHIQGEVAGSAYLALEDANHQLVAVLVVRWNDQSRKILEISRYASNKNVRGGFTKLLKHVERNYPVRSFVTFSDNCISDGGLYEKTGFTIDAILKEDYRYVVNGQRQHKFGFRLKRFKNDPTLQYETGYSERQLAALNGIARIWDAGKIRWTKEVR